MDQHVKETVYSAIEVESVLESIDEEIVRPLRILRYGPTTYTDRNSVVKPPPKFILLTGRFGSGRSTITSILVNELRKGCSRKSSDTFYNNRYVKYLKFDRHYRDMNLGERLQEILAQVKNPTDGRDFTVLVIKHLERFCPHNLPRDDMGVHIDGHGFVQTPRNSANLRNFTRILKEELDSSQPGKLLIVGHANKVEEIDADLLPKSQYQIGMPPLDEQRREKFLRHFITKFNAEYTDEMKVILLSTTNYSLPELKELVTDACSEARRRFRRVNGPHANPPNPLVLTTNDFLVFFGLGNEGGNRDNGDTTDSDGDWVPGNANANQGHLPHPPRGLAAAHMVRAPQPGMFNLQQIHVGVPLNQGQPILRRVVRIPLIPRQPAPAQGQPPPGGQLNLPFDLQVQLLQAQMNAIAEGAADRQRDLQEVLNLHQNGHQPNHQQQANPAQAQEPVAIQIEIGLDEDEDEDDDMPPLIDPDDPGMDDDDPPMEEEDDDGPQIDDDDVALDDDDALMDEDDL